MFNKVKVTFIVLLLSLYKKGDTFCIHYVSIYQKIIQPLEKKNANVVKGKLEEGDFPLLCLTDNSHWLTILGDGCDAVMFVYTWKTDIRWVG